MTELLETLGIRGRSGVEAFIERLITMLDELDPDSDLEPELGEPYLGWPNFGQPATADMSRDDEREIEDEHGDDINDEPHDWNELEPSIGWPERDGQGLKVGVEISINGYCGDDEGRW